MPSWRHRAAGHNSDPSQPAAGRGSATHSPSSLRPRGADAGGVGVVYGDIGTSPLYALKEVFAHGHVPLTPDNIYGVLSLVFWTLTVIVSLKYVVLILRADNNGEGGLIAMLALASQAVQGPAGAAPAAAAVGIFGTAIFFGDGVITPAISVLSAVEGLEVAAPGLHALRRAGDAGGADGAVRRAAPRHRAASARLFGPVTVVWFVVLAVLGAAAHRRATRRCCGR